MGWAILDIISGLLDLFILHSANKRRKQRRKHKLNTPYAKRHR